MHNWHTYNLWWSSIYVNRMIFNFFLIWSIKLWERKKSCHNFCVNIATYSRNMTVMTIDNHEHDKGIIYHIHSEQEHVQWNIVDGFTWWQTWDLTHIPNIPIRITLQVLLMTLKAKGCSVIILVKVETNNIWVLCTKSFDALQGLSQDWEFTSFFQKI